jgi:uncharacterized protein YecT (DUF1311 family)
LKLVAGLGFVVAVAAFASAADKRAAPAAHEEPLTQTGMNHEADKKFLAADAGLNRLFASIKKVYADDPLFLQKLRDSQRLWIKFRDAELDLMYPHQDESGYYGSVLPMCLAEYKASLTSARADTLKRWLDGTEEGDACAGSVKSPDALKSNPGAAK